MTREIAILVVTACALGGCEAGTERPSGDRVSAGAPGDAQVGGSVVSTVNGHPITLAQVARAAREADVEPRVALRRLQDEALLAAAADHAGFGDDPEVRRAARQAMVQALLERTVEADVTAAQVNPAEVEAAFEANLARWEHPERRTTVHALARVPDQAGPEVAEAAERWARETHERIANGDDPAAALLAMRRRPPSDRPFEVVVEEVPPLSRRDAADRAYLDAVFGLDGEGLVPAPVRSGFGWHVIAVTDVEPAEETPRAEALETLREERVAQLRAAALNERLQSIAEREGVEVIRENVRRFFDDPSLFQEPAP